MTDTVNKTKTQLIRELKKAQAKIGELEASGMLMEESLLISDAALKSIQECVYVINKEYKVTYWNEMCERIFGIKASDILGKPIIDEYELLEEYPGQNEERAKILRERGYNRAEERFRTKTGEYWMDVHTQALIKDNEWAGWLVLAADITERKQVEETLRFSDTTLKSIHDAVYAMDTDFNVTYWNKTCEEIFGISREEMIGRYIGDIIGMQEDYPGHNRERIEILLDQGYNWEEQVYITPRGNIWVDVRVQAIEQDGVRYGWVTLISDISKRKKVEEELKLSEEQIRYQASLVDNVTDVILSHDEDYKILSWNKAAERVFKLKKEDAIGRDFRDLSEPEYANPDDMPIPEALEKYGSWTGESIHHLKDGSQLYLRVSIQQVIESSTGKSTFVIIMSDISRQKKAEDELKELLEREKTLRMEIETEMNKRIELAAGIVHELKTPLTAIISSSELIMEHAGEGILSRIAQNISQSAYDLDKRTIELLEMARGDVGMLHIEKKVINFRKILKSMELEFSTFLARKNISFGLTIARELPAIPADEDRLRQVLLNLIDNAFKFTPEEGRVIIRVKRDDSSIITEVRDNGIGLSEEDQKYIFKPYSQVTGSNKPTGGLGLGLAIARNLIEAHGGRMWVSSKKGKGSSFFFSLPVGETREDD